MNTDNAKQVKIESLYQGELRRVGNQKLSGPCPFHNDHDPKHPNFIVYTNTNSWYCFVCSEGGDSIKFYMKLHNCDFKKAIKELGRR